MLYDFITYLPFAVCIFWFILHSVVSFRVDGMPAILQLLAIAGLFFLMDGFYSSQHGSLRTSVWVTLAYQLFAPSIIPAAILYLQKLKVPEKLKPSQFAWVVIPAAMFGATGLLMSIIGVDKLADFYYILKTQGLTVLNSFKGELVYSYFIWSTVILRIIVGIELLFLLGYVAVLFVRKKYKFGAIIAFYSKGELIDLLQLQLQPVLLMALVYSIKVFLFKNYLVTHQTITSIMFVTTAIAVFSFSYYALFGANRSLLYRHTLNVMRYNYGESTKMEVIEEMVGDMVDEVDSDTLRRIRARVGVTPEVEDWEQGKTTDQTMAQRIFSAVSESWDANSLMGRFKQLMLEDRIYLQPGLTLSDVANRLGSNVTYISKMIHNTYNMGFPEMLNILRIDFAQRYIMTHPELRQDQLAADCGFLSASSFNTIFKKITGMTPKLWRASQENRNSI